MHWVIQRDLHDYASLRTLIEALERFDADFTLVDIEEGRIRPGVSLTNPVISLGANTMARVAKESGWRPGCFESDQLSFDIWRERLGGELLNSDAVVCRLRDVPSDLPQFFLRPLADTKAFTGRLFDLRSFSEWKSAAGADPEITVLYTGPKEL